MISLKKGFYALCFGVGLSVSLSAWAAPDCATCGSMYMDCQGGDQNACYQYNRLECATFEPGCTTYNE